MDNPLHLKQMATVYQYQNNENSPFGLRPQGLFSDPKFRKSVLRILMIAVVITFLLILLTVFIPKTENASQIVRVNTSLQNEDLAAAQAAKAYMEAAFKKDIQAMAQASARGGETQNNVANALPILASENLSNCSVVAAQAVQPEIKVESGDYKRVDVLCENNRKITFLTIEQNNSWLVATASLGVKDA